jgi:hypothetical protein
MEIRRLDLHAAGEYFIEGVDYNFHG